MRKQLALQDIYQNIVLDQKFETQEIICRNFLMYFIEKYLSESKYEAPYQNFHQSKFLKDPEVFLNSGVSSRPKSPDD